MASTLFTRCFLAASHHMITPSLFSSSPKDSKSRRSSESNYNILQLSHWEIELVKIKELEAEEKTMGGILLTSTAQSKPQGGEVVAVDEGRTIGKTIIDIKVSVIASQALLLHLLRCLE